MNCRVLSELCRGCRSIHDSDHATPMSEPVGSVGLSELSGLSGRGWSAEVAGQQPMMTHQHPLHSPQHGPLVLPFTLHMHQRTHALKASEWTLTHQYELSVGLSELSELCHMTA